MTATNTIPSAADFDLSELDASYGAPDIIYQHGNEDADWRIKVIVEIDYDSSVLDDEFFGEFVEEKWDNDYGRPMPRPDHFDGRARKVGTRDASWWWQPPKDVADEHLYDFQRNIRDLLEYGYVGIGVVVEEKVQTRTGSIWADVSGSSLWGIEAMFDRDYGRSVVEDCLHEALASIPKGDDQ